MSVRHTTWVCVAAALAILAGAVASASGAGPAEGPATQPASAGKPGAPPLGAAAPVTLPGLHNVVTYHPLLISGGVPEGDEGFDSLAAMGVKAIISVDGATPDLERARAHGMRYIHLPIGYNGFDEVRLKELARATRDLAAQGTVYIHCHHGKHRSAGAAGAVGVALGWMDNQQAGTLLKISGTAPEYAGLYRCVEQARPINKATLDAVPASFPEITPPAGFVKGMLEADEALDRLKAVQKAGWPAPASSAAIQPAAEAGRLADALRLLGQNERTRKRGSDFAAMLASSQKHAQALEELIVRGERSPEALSAALKPVVGSCKECHARFRD